MYGGTTPTFALLQGSPAINAGNNAAAPLTATLEAVVVAPVLDLRVIVVDPVAIMGEREDRVVPDGEPVG